MKRNIASFISGLSIGTLGGLIGLGGAEFRLPVLISFFRFSALDAVILNKAASLVVVASALPFRAQSVPVSVFSDHWTVILNLLAGSVLGAWIGASFAVKLHSKTFFRIISAMLVIIAFILLFSHSMRVESASFFVPGLVQTVLGVAAGFVIGVFASLLGVAGGELLIPTLILLFGLDIKTAGSLSLAVSLPTMLAGFARYSRDQSFAVIKRNKVFIIYMAAGSVAGTFIGGRLLGVIPEYILLPALSAILFISSYKIWKHK